jgi:DNA-binding XRE family transcriptional regulator
MYSHLHAIVHQECTGELPCLCQLFEWPEKNLCTRRACLPFGQRIRDVRRASRLTQREVASELGVSRRSIIRYEQGRSSPGGVRAAAGAAAVGVGPCPTTGQPTVLLERERA